MAFRIAGNFPRDLFGDIDTRPGCWGRAEAQELPITFHPPDGMTVNILRISGDLIAWPKTGVQVEAGGSGLAPIPAGSYAGLLVGFSTTATAGATEADYAADGCLAYFQGALDHSPTRLSFAEEIHPGCGLLPSDHVLVLKIAAFLNTTGVPVHVEATYNIEAEFAA